MLKQNINHFVGKIGRKLIRWAARESNIVKFARDEWKIAFPEKDDMQDAAGEDLVDIMSLLHHAEICGGIAWYVMPYVSKASHFQPFSPLTGKDEEWFHPSDGDPLKQNKRCAHVFMGEDGVAYDLNGITFRDENGARFHDQSSKVNISFPYVPTTKMVNVDAGGVPISETNPG